MVRYTIKLKKRSEKPNRNNQQGKHPTQAFRGAYILVNCDKGDYSKDKTITNAEICKVLRIGGRTIDCTKKKFVKEGFESVLERRPSGRSEKFQLIEIPII